MPYVKLARREIFYNDLMGLLGCMESIEMTEGDLNYLITRIIHQWLEQSGTCYRTLNTIVGVLESAKQEFYRRWVVPYEDKKIEENGDV